MPERPSVIKRSDEGIKSFNTSPSIVPENVHKRLRTNCNISGSMTVGTKHDFAVRFRSFVTCNFPFCPHTSV